VRRGQLGRVLRQEAGQVEFGVCVQLVVDGVEAVADSVRGQVADARLVRLVLADEWPRAQRLVEGFVGERQVGRGRIYKCADRL